MKEIIEKIAYRLMSEDEKLTWNEAWKKAEEYVACGLTTLMRSLFDL